MNNNNQKVVVIAGDSWACGEWNRSPGYKITHRGLTEYFTEYGYMVVNLARPGGNNVDSAKRLDNFLQVSSHLNIAQIFVFQTEWTRDIESSPSGKDFDYTEIKSRTLSNFYERLAGSFGRLNVPINLIGGCSDTIWLDNFSQKYPGVQILCQSLVNLTTTENHRILDPVFSMWNWKCEFMMSTVKKYGKDEDLKLMLHDIELGHQREGLLHRRNEYFYPDGLHANRKTHKILFEFIKNNIPNL